MANLLRRSALLRSPLLAAARRPLAVTMTRPIVRDMSTKIVATAFGPDREGVLTDFTRVVLGVGGTIGGSRAVTVSGTFTMSAVVFLPDEDHSLVAEFSNNLQTAMPNYVTGIRPAKSERNMVFCKLDIKANKEYGLIAQISDHIKSRGFSFASLRTHQRQSPDGDDVFTAVAVIMHPPGKKPDILTVEKEFYEMGDKLDVDVKFAPYQ